MNSGEARTKRTAGLPNILWICTDQQRYNTVHALGNNVIDTPNLDELCHKGVAFSRAYCQSPVCTPSRASFLTGLYPSHVHVNRNGNAYVPEGVSLITKRLSEAGYACGLVGKLHLASPWRGVERRADDGYDVFRYSHDPWQPVSGGNDYALWLQRQSFGLDDVFERTAGGAYRGYKPDVDPALHQTTWCADEAVAFIEAEHERPWLLSVNPFDPHPPFDAPREYQRRYLHRDLPAPLFRESDIKQQSALAEVFFQTTGVVPSDETGEMVASYYGMVELIDEGVGRMVRALEATGQREDTLVIFMSDHGEMLGDHGLVRKGCRFYEGLVRVPLILSWPGRFREGVVVDDLAELTDLAPTLAEVAGFSLERAHGDSLLPYLLGAPRGPRAFVRCEYLDALHPDLPEHPERHTPSYGTMYRDERYKLVVYHGHGVGELYDLEHDPGEFENLWDEPAAKEKKLELMQRSFDAYVRAADPGPPLIGPY